MNLRLVADLDNLAVKYMTSGELSYKDITGYKRPGGTDQRDAGAFQSISDDVNVFNIGTSSVDFTPDYATVNLWRSNYHDNANVLNGETHLLRLKSGEEHSVESPVYLAGDADVEQTFTFSGEKPHNVDLSGSTQVTGTFNIYPYANSFTTKFKDILIDVSSSDRLTYTQNSLGDRPWTGEQQQPNHAFDFENVAVFYNASASNYTLAYAQNYGYDDGKIYATYNNCLLVAPQAPSGINGTPGSINLYTHQYGTGAQAFFEVKGCTLINAFMGNSRHTYSPYLHFSGIGNIHYVTPGLFSTSNRPTGFLYINSIDQNDPGANFDLDAIVLRDCIFNTGSIDSIARPLSQDRYHLYIAEPLSGEFLYSNQTHIDGVYAASSWTYWDFENVSIRVPFVFGEKAASGEVSLRPKSLSSTEPFQQGEGSLGIDYAVNSDMPLYDIAGVLRDSDPNAGAYEGFYKFDTLIAFGNVYINLY